MGAGLHIVHTGDICVKDPVRSPLKLHMLMEFREHQVEMVEISSNNKQSVRVSILQTTNGPIEFTKYLLSISTRENVNSDKQW